MQTSAGKIPTAPLVLTDLFTDERVTGRSYVFCYTLLVLEPLRLLTENLGSLLTGVLKLRLPYVG